MGQRDSHASGTFSWTDLSTPDPAAAAAFYGALLGWEGEEVPAGPDATYWMMRVGDATWPGCRPCARISWPRGRHRRGCRT